MPQQTLGELFTSVIGTMPTAADVNDKYEKPSTGIPASDLADNISLSDLNNDIIFNSEPASVTPVTTSFFADNFDWMLVINDRTGKNLQRTGQFNVNSTGPDWGATITLTLTDLTLRPGEIATYQWSYSLDGGKNWTLLDETTDNISFIWSLEMWSRSWKIEVTIDTQKIILPDTSTLAPKANPVFTGSISLGRKDSTTVGGKSFAVGDTVEASAECAHAEGYKTKVTSIRGHAEGSETIVSGQSSHAEGLTTTASGDYGSHAEGYQTQSSGSYGSHSEGSYTKANGKSTHASGIFNAEMLAYPNWTANTSYEVGDIVLRYGATYQCKIANNDATFDFQNWNQMNYQNTSQAFVVGNGTAANARSNALTLDWTGDLHLMGDLYTGANADGTGGTKLDTSTLAPKASPVFTGSISLGRKASTTVGSNSFAVGNDVEASADNAHAEGNTTRAAYVDSHAEGWGSEAISQAAHAEGRQGRATAFAAHAEGCQTAANGYASHAQGMGTQAKNKSQHVAGEYNVADPSTDGAGFRGNYAEIIGNGADANNRSNARALDWSGNEYIAGDLYVGCSADSTSGTKLARIPAAPSTDGTYTLQCVVSSGVPTYSWVSTGA